MPSIVHTSLISEPDFRLNLDRRGNLLRNPHFRRQGVVDGVIVVSVPVARAGVYGGFVGDGVCACGAVTGGERVLRK